MREWLLTARKNKNMTHQEVADEVGVKRQYYGMIENGERSPSVQLAKKIGKLFGFDWTLFFEDEGNKMLQNTHTA